MKNFVKKNKKQLQKKVRKKKVNYAMHIKDPEENLIEKEKLF